MRVSFFSTKPYDRRFFDEANGATGHQLIYLEPRLDPTTALLAEGSEAICAFVNDQLGAETLRILGSQGIRHIALRCAGFNNVDLQAASELGIMVSRVPAYSPYSVAEHTIALLLALNRKVHRAHNRIREGNFAIDGLLGFDLNGLTAGLVGTGKIGEIVAKILTGFGCKILAFDPFPSAACQEMGVQYVELSDLFAQSDIISLHCPLTPESHYLINENAITTMKDGVILLNTSRGSLLDTRAVINGLKQGKIGYLGLDVYEEEGDLFFEDLSNQVIKDDVFARLTTFPNVIVTGHQAFFTREALHNIAQTTLSNLLEFEKSGFCTNSVNPSRNYTTPVSCVVR